MKGTGASTVLLGKGPNIGMPIYPLSKAGWNKCFVSTNPTDPTKRGLPKKIWLENFIFLNVKVFATK